MMMVTLHRYARAFSIVEAVVATALVGGILAISMTTIGRTAASDRITTDRSLGESLASQLLTEILTQPYEDSKPPTTTLGPETGETVSPGRALFDDVDDYQGWVSTPPQMQNASVIKGYTDWSRSVLVQWVSPADLSLLSKTETGIKKITITVQYRSRIVASITALRTSGWDRIVP